MNIKKKALGRGLSALLDNDSDNDTNNKNVSDNNDKTIQIRYLKLHSFSPHFFSTL